MIIQNKVIHEYTDFLTIWQLLENGYWTAVRTRPAQTAKKYAVEYNENNYDPDRYFACFPSDTDPNDIINTSFLQQYKLSQPQLRDLLLLSESYGYIKIRTGKKLVSLSLARKHDDELYEISPSGKRLIYAIQNKNKILY